MEEIKPSSGKLIEPSKWENRALKLMEMLKKVLSIANFAKHLRNAMPSVNNTLAELDLKENELREKAKTCQQDDPQARIDTSNLIRTFRACANKANSYLKTCGAMIKCVKEKTKKTVEENYSKESLMQLIDDILKEQERCTEQRDEFEKSLEEVKETANKLIIEYQREDEGMWYYAKVTLQAAQGFQYLSIVALILGISNYYIVSTGLEDYKEYLVKYGFIFLIIFYAAEFPIGAWVQTTKKRFKDRLEKKNSLKVVSDLIVKELEKMNDLAQEVDDIYEKQNQVEKVADLDEQRQDLQEQDNIETRTKNEIKRYLTTFQEFSEDIEIYNENHHTQASSDIKVVENPVHGQPEDIQEREPTQPRQELRTGGSMSRIAGGVEPGAVRFNQPQAETLKEMKKPRKKDVDEKLRTQLKKLFPSKPKAD